MIDKIKNFNINRTIFFFEDVWRDTAEEVVEKLMKLDAENNEPIFIIINSWGGSVSALYSMIDTIDGLKSEVNTMCLGEADSSAAVLFSHGKNRYIGANSKTMIHEVSTWTAGKISDIKADLEDAEKTQDTLLGIISKNTQHSVADIKEMCYAKDVWMDAKESVQFRIADEIIRNDEDEFLESIGEDKMSASREDIPENKKDFFINIKKVFNSLKDRNEDKEVNVDKNKNEDKKENKTKENKMPDKKKEENVIVNGDTITASQLQTLLTNVSDLTKEVTNLKKDKDSIENKKDEEKNSFDIKISELTSKLEKSEAQNKLNAEEAKKSSISNLENIIEKKLNKEVSDKLVNVLKDTEIELSVIDEISNAFGSINLSSDVHNIDLSNINLDEEVGNGKTTKDVFVPKSSKDKK